MRCIIETVSTGYPPDAVSAESMTQSTPSITAVATSDASARVGIGLSIIDSSIWVATTTGLPTRRQMRVMSFCAPGTRSGGNSTPRSPRAIITPSDATIKSSKISSAFGFSILDIMAARSRIILRASMISLTLWTKDKATQSTPKSRAKSRSARSFSVSGLIFNSTSGTFTPLRSVNAPPTSTRVMMIPLSTPVTINCNLPSFTIIRWPGKIASKISTWGKQTRSALPLIGSNWKIKVSPFFRTTPSSTSPTRNLGPCRSARIVIGWPVSCATSRITLWRSAWSSWVPWLKFIRKALAPASTMALMQSLSLLLGPNVAKIRVAVRDNPIMMSFFAFITLAFSTP